MLAQVTPFIDSLQHILGFLVVLFALTFLWAVTAVMGSYFKRIRTEPAKAQVPAPSQATGEEPTEEEIVAITAAIGMITGRRSRIVSLGSSKKDWSREGLREHFASHKIR